LKLSEKGVFIMTEENKINGLAWFVAGLGVGDLVDKSKEQVSEYVERGREVVDRGRAQWEEFVERGKNLVSEQTGRVTAAVDAGRQAYQAPIVPDEPTEL
jgi:6-phosphogluconate dehydrogenase